MSSPDRVPNIWNILICTDVGPSSCALISYNNMRNKEED